MAKIRTIVTDRVHFRCPVCGRVEPRYNSIVICCVGRDRTICYPCAELIARAMEQLHKDNR